MSIDCKRTIVGIKPGQLRKFRATGFPGSPERDLVLIIGFCRGGTTTMGFNVPFGLQVYDTDLLSVGSDLVAECE